MTRQPYAFTKSQALWAEAQKYIPGGSQGTRTPEYEQCPIFFQRAKGCRMWDVDGNEFIDFLCSIGPVLLGYAYDRVDNAVRSIMETSFQSSMNHPVLIETARALVEMIPSAEGVRFMKTGTEATQLAVRLTRHITERMYVARHGYHGWADIFVGANNLRGVDKDASDKVLRFDGTAEGLEQLFAESGKQFGTVILCPADTRPFTTENYQGILDVAHDHGALVIFDEIKSGFRLAPGGAQECLGVTPDLTTLSKGLANGYPLSAIAGRKEYMDQMPHAGIAGTFSVEGLALAAALATLQEIRERNVPAHLHRMGQRLIDGLNELLPKYGYSHARAYGDPLPSMPRLEWREGAVQGGAHGRTADNYSYLMAQLHQHGVYYSSWHVGFINFSHQEQDIDEALEIFDYCLSLTKEAFPQ